MAELLRIGYGKEAVSKGAWAFSPGPVSELATKYIGSWYATILELVIILDALALALAICVMIARGFFALGRDGLVPRVFAKTSRFDTPWVGNLMVAVGCIGLILVAEATSWMDRYVEIFGTSAFATFIVTATAAAFGRCSESGHAATWKCSRRFAWRRG